MDNKRDRGWLVREIKERYNKDKTGENDFKLNLYEIEEVFDIFEEIVKDIIYDRDMLVLYGFLKVFVRKLPAKRIYNFQTGKINKVSKKETVVITASPSLDKALVEEEEL